MAPKSLNIMVDWKYLLSVVIVVTAGIALCIGKIDAKDFISIIGITLSFLSGYQIGYRMGGKRD